MITLYGNSISPYVRKVLAVLKLKNIDFEQVQQMPYSDDPEYRKINPLGKIPALIDGDLTICDSTVICEYLEQAYPQSPVYPEDLPSKTKARWLVQFAGTSITDCAAGIFFQRVMRPMFLKQETDEELVENIITEKLPPLLNYLETQIPSEGFLFNELSIADVSLVSPFINAGYANYSIDAMRWPQTSNYFDRIKAHPVIAGMLAQEAKMLGH